MDVVEKICTKCRIAKPIDAFCRSVGELDGRLNRCKVCVNAARKLWRQTPAGQQHVKSANHNRKLFDVPVSVGEKRCCRCRTNKPATTEQFFRNRQQVSGLSPTCKTCQFSIAKHARRFHRYKITRHDFANLMIRDPICAICKESFNGEPRVDHCHATLQIRGLLCHNCNLTLGHARDNKQILIAAIRYLEERG